jgi:hypothetical protein
VRRMHVKFVWDNRPVKEPRQIEVVMDVGYFLWGVVKLKW